ncbi:hypothetical protein NDU88_002022 [Pleurodeles waltl]|uniref:Uncharacterized protein n=1 Tax=Pleurodeles waltl TaxID=8319 RepID=A0AAV7UWD2_PLEWA|nr:hypothetical protein NDU88_002022 [Pleurodeles waltl]
MHFRSCGNLYPGDLIGRLWQPRDQLRVKSGASEISRREASGSEDIRVTKEEQEDEEPTIEEEDGRKTEPTGAGVPRRKLGDSWPGEPAPTPPRFRRSVASPEKIKGEDDAVSDKVIQPLGAGVSGKKPKSTAFPKLQPGNKVDLFHEAVIADVYKITFQKVKNNLLEQEREALDNLEMDKTIEIKPADKGGNIVILDKKDYMDEANRQLATKECYMKLKSNPIEQHKLDLQQMLKKYLELNLIDLDEKRYMTVEHPIIPTIY